jgi:nucleoside-diphosphate-sugar epimerase
VGATVAITGVGGLIGRRLVATLDADPAVDRIVGLDVDVPSGLASLKLDLRRADVRDRASLAAALGGADTVVHLAFQLDPLRDEAAMRATNVDGTRNVVEVAHEAGVRKLVYASSAVAYGAHPDNPLPLTEDQPLRANPGFNYAEHKLEVERWLAGWTAEHPDTTVTILRPAIVAGPGVANFITRQMTAPRFVVVAGHEPPMQFAHVDDVASALAHVVAQDLPGAYNVACEGWLSFREVTAISGRKTVEVPEEVAFAVAERLWRLGLGHAPAGQVHYVMHPWVVSEDALVATGWQPQHTNRDAFAELVREHADEVVIGPVSTTRGTARALSVGLGAAGAAAPAGGPPRARPPPPPAAIARIEAPSKPRSAKTSRAAPRIASRVFCLPGRRPRPVRRTMAAQVTGYAAGGWPHPGSGQRQSPRARSSDLATSFRSPRR